MGLFDFLKTEPDTKGLIGYHGLSEWWLSEFSNEERNHIVSVYAPMGSGQDLLLEADIYGSSSSVVHFLSFMSGWFHNKRDRYLAIRILKKAEELVSDDISISDLHILYSHLIQIHYSNRLIDPNSFAKSIKACKQQIEIASQVANDYKKEFKDDFFPAHIGYKQLVIVKEKEQKYQEAIDLCAKALKEGWNGDWEHRIERCKKKLHQ